MAEMAKYPVVSVLFFSLLLGREYHIKVLLGTWVIGWRPHFSAFLVVT
jgi:hypothetical protein